MGCKFLHHPSILVACIIASDKANFSIEKYWYFSYFSIKTYVVGTHQKRLAKALLMSTHSICFRGEIRKILCWYTFLSGAIWYWLQSCCLLVLCRLSWLFMWYGISENFLIGFLMHCFLVASHVFHIHIYKNDAQCTFRFIRREWGAPFGCLSLG